MKTTNYIFLILALLVCSCSKDDSNDSNGNSSNGHEFVDLGLSVKWATCNVGANNPTDFGNYYGWGETEVKSKYMDEGLKNIGNDISGTKYDVARVKWGGKWRMPTLAEWKELITMCTWKYKNGGFLITGKNGNSIFLPGAGYWDSEYNKNCGWYWTSILYEEGYPYAFGFYDGEDHDIDNSIYAGCGHSVRAVF